MEKRRIYWPELVDLFKRRLWLELAVLIIVLVGGLFSLNVGQSTLPVTPKYTVSDRILLTLPTAKQQLVLAQTVDPQYVASFATTLTSDLIAKPVQAKLAKQGIKIALPSLEKAISVQTNIANSLITINLTSTEPTQAKRIVGTYTNIASQQVKSVMGLGQGQVVERPQLTPIKIVRAVSWTRVAVICVAAVFIGLISGILAELFDRYIRSRYFIRTNLATAPIILDELPTTVQIAVIRNVIDMAIPKSRLLVVQLPTVSAQLQVAVTALATQYATNGERVLLVDLVADAFWLRQLASPTGTADYQGTTIVQFSENHPTQPVLLTLSEFEVSLRRLEVDFDRIIITTSGAQIAGNTQLALHLADARLLLLQQGVTRKKQVRQLQQESRSMSAVELTIYLGH